MEATDVPNASATVRLFPILHSFTLCIEVSMVQQMPPYFSTTRFEFEMSMTDVVLGFGCAERSDVSIEGRRDRKSGAQRVCGEPRRTTTVLEAPS